MSQSIKDGLKNLFFACVLAFVAYSVLNDFQKLESGQVESIRVMFPIGTIYGLGGVWSGLAKWGSTILFGGLAVLMAWMSVRSFQGKES